jgi:hypothetical protein
MELGQPLPLIVAIYSDMEPFVIRISFWGNGLCRLLILDMNKSTLYTVLHNMLCIAEPLISGFALIGTGSFFPGSGSV